MKWSTIPLEEQKIHAQQVLRRAVETYHRDWRLLQEPLQNAIDLFIITPFVYYIYLVKTNFP